MNDLDSISNPVTCKISHIGSYPSAPTHPSSTRLGSTQLGSWLMTVRWAPLCWRVSWLVADMACQLCMLTPCLCHNDVILHPGQSRGSSCLIFGLGQPIQVKKMREAVCVQGQPPRRRVRPCPTSNFYAVYTSVLISSSSTRWYGQNTILTTFIFEQKSNTTLNHML
jgi:hypothetical protein